MKEFNKEQFKNDFISYFGEEKWFEEEMLEKLFPFMEFICDDLEVEMIPVLFDESIPDDSRLVLDDLENGPYILISTRLVNNFVVVAKNIAHELKHLHQYIVVAEEPNHPLREKWLNNMANPFVVTNYDDVDQLSEYSAQPLEVDAFSYQYYAVNKFFGLDLCHPSEWYDMLLKFHAEKYFLK